MSIISRKRSLEMKNASAVSRPSVNDLHGVAKGKKYRPLPVRAMWSRGNHNSLTGRISPQTAVSTLHAEIHIGFPLEHVLFLVAKVKSYVAHAVNVVLTTRNGRADGIDIGIG